MVETIEWTDAGVVMIDQTRLPREQVFVTCKSYVEVAAAIGVALGVQEDADFDRVCETLASTRPTAVNLFWAIERMRVLRASLKGVAREEMVGRMIEEAKKIRLE